MRQLISGCPFIRVLMGALLALGSTYASAQSPSPDAGYQVKPGDVLSVSVWREQDLQGEVLVTPEGEVSLPLAGVIDANNKTVGELKKEIADRLERFIPDPEVSVAVREIRGNAVYVVGKVARPGQFLLLSPLDVMQVLALAGGTTTYAKIDDIKILRRSGGELSAMPFAYSDVADGKHLEQNILLESGDVVVVP